ncbi:MAG: nitrilase family protein [Chitinophagaceae bacterium]
MSTLTITIIQSNLHCLDKTANLEMFGNKIRAIEEKTEMVILPEMFNTGFVTDPESHAEKMEGPTMEWMRKLAAEKRIIITGSLIIEDNGKYFNRLIWMLPVGQYGHYDKRHLFSYAREQEKFTAGNKRFIASAKGIKLNIQICYDLRFPTWASQQSFVPPLLRKKRVSNFDAFDEPEHPEYDLLIYVANWPQKRNLAWITLLTARAIENQCYVIGVNRVGKDGNDLNYSGDSMVVDPLGEVIYKKADEEDVFTFTIDKTHIDSIRRQFPFWKDSDHFMILSGDPE